MPSPPNDSELFEVVCRKLETLGYISGIASDRQDIWFDWTPLGKSKFEHFATDVVQKPGLFSPGEKEMLLKSLFYLGVKRRSLKESLFDSIRDAFDLCGNETLVATCCGNSMAFERITIFEMIEWIYFSNSSEIDIHRWNVTGESEWIMRIPANAYRPA